MEPSETDWTATPASPVSANARQAALIRPVSYTHLTLPTNREV